MQQLSKITLFCFLFFITNLFANERDNYVVKKNNDTLYFSNISIYYYKRAICTKENGRKKWIFPRNIKEVNINGDIYEAGRIIPLGIGWKRYLLLYRIPPVTENQLILYYTYDGLSGGAMTEEDGTNDGYILQTEAIRSSKNPRGDFRKLSINLRKKILKECSNCSSDCLNLIENAELHNFYDAAKIIREVNDKCSN